MTVIIRMLAGSPLETQPQPGYINHKCMGDNFYEDTPGFPPRPELCTHYIRSTTTVVQTGWYFVLLGQVWHLFQFSERTSNALTIITIFLTMKYFWLTSCNLSTEMFFWADLPEMR